VGIFGPSEQQIAKARGGLMEEVNHNVRQGMRQFTVALREPQWGRLDRAIPIVVELLQLYGHSVVNVTQEPRSGIAYLHIRSSIPDGLPPARVGNAALSMGAEELTQVRVWMANEFSRRTHDAAWAVYLCRLHLGYEIPNVGIYQDVRFWLNAYPVKSAIVLGGVGAVPESSMVYACFSECDNIVDPAAAGQVREHRNLWHQLFPDRYSTPGS
jgi:hypothetical protein